MTARSLRLQERRERRGVSASGMSASAFMAEFSSAGRLAPTPTARVEEIPFRPTHNPFEAAARTKKAAAMLAILHRLSVDADLARKMDARDWGFVAKLAKVNEPSVETIAETIALLERAEAAL